MILRPYFLGCVSRDNVRMREVCLYCLYDNRLVLSDMLEDFPDEAPPLPENAVAAGPFQCNDEEVVLVQGTAFDLDSGSWYVIYITSPGDRGRLRATELGAFLDSFRQPNPLRQLTRS